MNCADRLRDLHADDYWVPWLKSPGQAGGLCSPQPVRALLAALPEIAAVIAAAEKVHVEHSPSCAAHPYASKNYPAVGTPCDLDCDRFRMRESLAALSRRLEGGEA